jgi:ATP-dependent protease ClpP protease subunit
MSRNENFIWGGENPSKRVRYLGKKKEEKKISHKDIQLDDDDDDGGLGNLFNLPLPKNDELICRDGNHIYFWDEVNGHNVLKFNKLLRKVDFEQQCKLLKEEITEPMIYLHFNSPGGNLLDGFSMASTIKKCKSTTIGIVEGIVASATTLPFIVCHKRKMQQYSYILIHQLKTGFWGTYNNLLDETESCKDMMNMISKIYLEHSKIPKKKLESILKRELLINPDFCIKYNIADELF